MIGWGQFLKIALGGLAGLLAVVFGFIVLMNPYGHLPWQVLGKHVDHGHQPALPVPGHRPLR